MNTLNVSAFSNSFVQILFINSQNTEYQNILTAENYGEDSVVK